MSLPSEVYATNDVAIPVGERVTMTITSERGETVQLKGTVIKCEKEFGFYQLTLDDFEKA